MPRGFRDVTGPPGRIGPGGVRGAARRQAEELARKRRPPAGFYHQRAQGLTGRIQGLLQRRAGATEGQVARINERIGDLRDVRREARAQRFQRRHSFTDVTGPPDGGIRMPVRKPALRNRAPARRRM